jgi:hypothetical protein
VWRAISVKPHAVDDDDDDARLIAKTTKPNTP